MAKKNSLFDLIKSLSASEKRYFRASINPDSSSRNYMMLFNAIEKMSVYDEQAIRQKFKGHTFINQLHVTKIYLYDCIMKSLRNYHSAASCTAQAKDMLRNVELLFHKELFDLCGSEINKLEKLATKIEDDVLLLEVLSWKRKLSQSQSPGEFSLHSIIEQQSLAIDRLADHHELWKEIVRPSGNAGAILSKTKSMSLSSKVLHYHIRYREAIRSKQNDLAKKSLTKLVAELEQYPDRLNEDPSVYLSTLNNLISYLVFASEIEEALEHVRKAKAFYSGIQGIQKSKGNFRLILRTYNIELEIYRDTEALDDAVKLIKEIRASLDEHKNRIPESYLISLWFQFAYIFFVKKEFRQSLHWLNQILNASFADKRKDLHLQAHLLNLMVHLELRNFFVMRYFAASAKRFLGRNKALLPHHKTIIAFFSKVSSAPEIEHKSMFGILHKDLFSGAGKMSKSDLDYINWRKWIFSKLGGKMVA